MQGSGNHKQSTDWILADQIYAAWRSGRGADVASHEQDLVARNRPWLRQRVRSRFSASVKAHGAPDLCQDIVAESEWQLILHLRTRREPIRADASFHTFLEAFIWNCGATVLRQYAKHARHCENPTASDQLLAHLHSGAIYWWGSYYPPPDSVPDRAKLVYTVRSLLDSLSDVDRGVWLSRSLERLSDREIAGQLNIPWQTVRGRYFRVGRRLNVALSSAGIDLNDLQGGLQ
jgi:DNA-directed RNA polymerase specialized sigma24 family protein